MSVGAIVDCSVAINLKVVAFEAITVIVVDGSFC